MKIINSMINTKSLNELRGNTSGISFQKTDNLSARESNDSIELSSKPVKPKASTAKRWGVGIASAFVTGLGQLINGEVGKAAAMFGSAIGLGILTATPIAPLAWVALIVLDIYSIVDAVKNA